MKSGKKNILATKITKYTFLLALVLMQFLISGCWNYLEVNQTAIPLALGFDYQRNKAEFTLQLASTGGGSQKNGESGPPKALVISETGQTNVEAARRMSLNLPRLPLWSHARTMIIGENLARRDLSLCIDEIARNRNFRKITNLFICVGVPVKDCMQAETPLEPYSIPALNRMIRNQEQLLGIYMPITTYDFEERLDTPGIDAAAPVVKVKQKDGKKLLTLGGTAVFKDRKMVGVLNEKESRGFRYLSPKQVNGGLHTIRPAGKGPVLIELTRSQASVKPRISPSGITMQINIQAEGNFYGQATAEDILSRENVKILEKYTNQAIAADIRSAVKKCQQLESDIFGWGREIFRTQPEVWKNVKNDWPSRFAGVKTDIKVDFKLRRTYLASNSFKFRE